MLQILEFILRNPWNYFGFVFLLLIVCGALSRMFSTTYVIKENKNEKEN